jgi:hypothetical protein
MTNYRVSHNTENYVLQKCSVRILNLADWSTVWEHLRLHTYFTDLSLLVSIRYS